jgi:hypothetical protein
LVVTEKRLVGGLVEYQLGKKKSGVESKIGTFLVIVN